MQKRYSIMARLRGTGTMSEICQADSNPEAIAEAVRSKTLRISVDGQVPPLRTVSVPKYELVEIVDRQGS